jgi:hypothetical protein
MPGRTGDDVGLAGGSTLMELSTGRVSVSCQIHMSMLLV